MHTLPAILALTDAGRIALVTSFHQNISAAGAVKHLHAGRIQLAESTCRQILARRRNDHLAIAILGQIATIQARHDEAIAHLGRAVSLAPREVDYHVLLGGALATIGRSREALSRYDKALKLRRGYPPALAGKANMYVRTNAWDKARALLEPLVKRGQEDADLAVVYARIASHEGRHDRAIEVASRHLGAPMRDECRRSLHFEIAKAHEKAGAYDEAFEAYTRANQVARRGRWDPDAESERYDRIMTVFTRQRLASLPRPGPELAEASQRLVFIVGMPRSGSTLIEQMIDAHPDAHGVGEILNLPDLVDAMGLRIGSTLGWPECVEDLEPADVETLARDYLDGVVAMAPDARRIIDKYLGSYEYLGLIAVLLPRARIIHSRRDPLDTCLSCFVQKFAPGVPAYTQDLRHLGMLYNDYRAIMDHWRVVLDDGGLLEVDYEALVSDPEAWSRRIIEHCGLNWDERCLRFYESRREVLTLSRDQVNKPIYRTSVGRAARYEKQLQPLREILEAGVRGHSCGA